MTTRPSTTRHSWGWSETQLLVIALLCVTATGVLGMRWARSGGWWAETLEFTEPLRPEDLVVDLNHAPASDLTLLPEVGDVKAQRIVELRESLGGYTKLEQLIAVHGISQRILQRLAPHLVLIPLATAAAGPAIPPPAQVPPPEKD